MDFLKVPSFKTPLPRRLNRRDPERDQLSDKASDSDESVASSNSDNVGSSNGEISLVAEYDELMRPHRATRKELLVTHEYLMGLVEQLQEHYKEHFAVIEENQRLKSAVDDKTQECTELEHKLLQARRILDKERQKTRTVTRERDEFAAQINLIRELLFKDKGTCGADEMRQKLSFLHENTKLSEPYVDPDLNSNARFPQLSAIKEVNSTGSILSDFSYSRSEDDLDSSHLHKSNQWKKHRPSTGGLAEPAVKKRRSSGNKAVEIGATDIVKATTTLTVSKDGPITATSIIESVPKTPSRPESVPSDENTCTNVPLSNLVLESWARGSPSERKVNLREHCFQQKTLVMPDSCVPCGQRIRFGKTAAKCKECKKMCHLECKENLGLPCIPLLNTPNHGSNAGVIGDYTPTSPPMVPALLIHCINEIELRGLSELGLYRIPGPQHAVESLKDKLLKGKGLPSLNQVDIPVLCGTVKLFLKGLNDTLVTYALWEKFVQAVELDDPDEIKSALYKVIAELPQPNRDSLAYMMVHLQKVSEAPECKMNVSNLARVFGPTIVGYSSKDPPASGLLEETGKQYKVMEELIKLPAEYWLRFINVDSTVPASRLQQTPSTDSLLRSGGNRGIFTPLGGGRNFAKKRQKYFPSPKSMR